MKISNKDIRKRRIAIVAAALMLAICVTAIAISCASDAFEDAEIDFDCFLKCKIVALSLTTTII